MRYAYRHGDRPLEGYTILRAIGRGGFGEVYYALADGGREVALKALLCGPELELRGARQCQNLKSTHLVSIHDIRRSDDGTWFLVLEYMTGPTLRQALRERPNGLDGSTVPDIVRQIADGLAALHACGIVHRDLKPENIFLEHGVVKIGDYGLSKLMSGSGAGADTRLVGTLHYMAPEVGTGAYGPGVDVYSLAVVTHELLTGRRPFEGEPIEVWMRHLGTRPDLDGLAAPFRRVLERGLEKDPRDRHATARELAEDVAAAANGGMCSNRVGAPVARVPAILPEIPAAPFRRRAFARVAPLLAAAGLLFCLAVPLKLMHRAAFLRREAAMAPATVRVYPPGGASLRPLSPSMGSEGGIRIAASCLPEIAGLLADDAKPLLEVGRSAYSTLSREGVPAALQEAGSAHGFEEAAARGMVTLRREALRAVAEALEEAERRGTARVRNLQRVIAAANEDPGPRISAGSAAGWSRP